MICAHSWWLSASPTLMGRAQLCGVLFLNVYMTAIRFGAAASFATVPYLVALSAGMYISKTLNSSCQFVATLRRLSNIQTPWSYCGMKSTASAGFRLQRGAAHCQDQGLLLSVIWRGVVGTLRLATAVAGHPSVAHSGEFCAVLTSHRSTSGIPIYTVPFFSACWPSGSSVR